MKTNDVDRHGRLRIATAMASLALTLAPAAARAATINVTTTLDENSSSPADGLCSLREAIIAANNNVAVDSCAAGTKPPDTIVLPAGTYTLTIPGTGEDAAQTGDLDILGDTTISGAGSATTIIDGGSLDRVIHTLAVSTSGIFISGVTIRKGAGEGIFEQDGFLVLTSSIVEANSGAGIYANFDVTVNSSTLRNNGDAGIATYSATVALNDSLVENNASTVNAAVTNSGGTLTVARTTVRNNTTAYGGIWVGGAGTISDSTIEGNGPFTAGPSFGAVSAACIGWTCASTLTVERSTISGNNGNGFVPGRSTVALENSTISGNTGAGMVVVASGVTVKHTTIAQNGGLAIDNENGGIFGPSNTQLANSIISGGCVNVSSTLGSLGGNLESPGNTCSLTGANDAVNVASPGLTALGSYGGYTKTHGLTISSPAIGTALAANCLPTDQRGVARPAPASGNCDKGAYELTGCGSSFAGAGMAIPALVLMRRRRRS